MCAEARSSTHPTGHYQIIIAGRIDASWCDWFGGVRIAWQKEADGACVTILTGAVTDQAALRGLLNRLWDLNLVLLSVQQVDPTTVLPTNP